MEVSRWAPTKVGRLLIEDGVAGGLPELSRDGLKKGPTERGQPDLG